MAGFSPLQRLIRASPVPATPDPSVAASASISKTAKIKLAAGPTKPKSLKAQLFDKDHASTWEAALGGSKVKLTKLSAEEKEGLVDIAIRLVRDVYSHLPLKQHRHAVNPVAALQIISRQLEAGELSDDTEFHRRMMSVFLSLRDLHTGYDLPAPYRNFMAVLPLLIEEYFDSKQTAHYVVSRTLIEEFKVDKKHLENLQVGDEVTHFNGTPIQKAIALNAERFAGSNAAANWARGLETLTMRGLASQLPPTEDWVVLTLCKPAPASLKTTYEVKLKWLYIDEANTDLGGESSSSSSSLPVKQLHALGLDFDADHRQSWKAIAYARDAKASANNPLPEIPFVIRSAYLKKDGTVLHDLSSNDERYGYVRIHTFAPKNEHDFLDQLVELCMTVDEEEHAKGLVVDVRGNPGGVIYLGESLLQMFSPKDTVKTSLAQFRMTPTTLKLSKVKDKEMHDHLQPWVRTMGDSRDAGEVFGVGAAFETQQLNYKFKKRCILIVDALVYSTTDMFAVGWLDNECGPIIGLHDNIGAGGANVWDYDLISQCLPEDFPHLDQHMPSFRASVRRTVRADSSLPIEDVGIRIGSKEKNNTYRYYMSRKDVLGNNEDLLRHAIAKIAEEKVSNQAAPAAASPKGEEKKKKKKRSEDSSEKSSKKRKSKRKSKLPK